MHSLIACCGCRRGPDCPLDRVTGDVVRNPSAEHCAIVQVDGVVVKHLRPRASLDDWGRRAAIAAAHPDLFVPFVLDTKARVVRQPLVVGEHGSLDDLRRIYAELKRRSVEGVYDITQANVISGRAIDFQHSPPHPRCETRIVGSGANRLQICGPLATAK